ncbi:MAG: hypothetical protein CMA64_10030 [Euryarchaeota archaeon]|jgi:hypothetical protein|nr:hypothetical protein [Euryarchaeota archaeon]
MDNKSSLDNHFYVPTISAGCKKELQELSKITPREGTVIYDKKWKTDLKNGKDVLDSHIKKFDIERIMLYNTASPREIEITDFKKCFYVSNKVVLKNNKKYQQREYLITYDKEEYIDEDTTLAEGTLLVCY